MRRVIKLSAKVALPFAAIVLIASRAEAEPALIHITGNVIFPASSNLIMEFAGPARGSEYDAMDVDGTIVLRGGLSLERLGGYVPAYLTPHHIVAAGTRDGVFRSVNGITVSPTRSLAVTYLADDIFVTATLPGDADVDGDVDFDDLLTLAQHYEQPGQQTWQAGDFTGNALANFDDLLILAQNYGGSVLRRGGDGDFRNELRESFSNDFALAQSLVPEPAVLSGCLLAISLKRVRRSREGAPAYGVIRSRPHSSHQAGRLPGKSARSR